jgi:hypothetical protein
VTPFPFDLTSDFTGKVYAFLERRDHAVQIARGQTQFLVPPHHRDYLLAYQQKARDEAEGDQKWLEAELARAAIESHLGRLRAIRSLLETAGSEEEKQTLWAEAEEIAGQVRGLREALAS